MNRACVLVIEDDFSYFQQLHSKLCQWGMQCIPSLTQYNNFRKYLVEFLTNVDSSRYQLATSYFENVLSQQIDIVLLDVQLLPSENKSGLRFLNYIRNMNQAVPVVMLTQWPLEYVSSAFSNANLMPNYHLEKQGGQAFFEESLYPIISMLKYWHSIMLSKKELTQAMREHDSIFMDVIEEKFGVMDVKLESIVNSTAEIVNYSQILLRSLQYSLKKTDKRAAKFIEELITQFSLCPMVNEVSFPKLKDFLQNSGDEIITKIKEGATEEVVDLFKEKLKELAGVSEEDSAIKAVSFIISKSIMSSYRFYKTGSAGFMEGIA